MQNLQKEFTDKGVVWLTIDSNAPGTEGNLTAEEAQKIATSWKTHAEPSWDHRRRQCNGCEFLPLFENKIARDDREERE